MAHQLPPPEDFFDYEEESPGHPDYQRALTEAEADTMGPAPDLLTTGDLATLAAQRDAFFAARVAPAVAEVESLPVDAGPPCAKDAGNVATARGQGAGAEIATTGDGTRDMLEPAPYFC